MKRLTILSLVLAITSCYQKQTLPEPIIFLQRGSFTNAVCEYKSKVTGTCFNGYTVLSGCKDGCAVASIPQFDRLRIAFVYAVSGSVRDQSTGKLVEGMEIHLVLPNRKRHATWTDADGRFKLVIPPEIPTAGENPERVEYDVGELRTNFSEAVAEETGKIAIVALLTDTFWKVNPDLQRVQVNVQQLSGKIIYQ